MLNAKPKLSHRVISIAAAVSLACAGMSPAFSAERKNELGMYTVKCQVVTHGPGNPNVGLVYGSHKNDAAKAEDDANQYVNMFGSGVHKRHCDTQARYKNSGAFTVDGEPI